MPHFTAKNPLDQNERHLRDLHSFLHSEPPGICCCTPTRMSTTVSMLQRAATVGARLSPRRLHPRNLLDLHKRNVEHLVNGLQLGNLSGLLDWTKGH